MHYSSLSAFLALWAFLCPLTTARGPCTYEKKVRGVQHEIDTISSHTFKDAKRIPLAPLASRTFYVTPNELPKMVLEVNTGVTAQSVRAELVGLATFLNAKVPKETLHYIENDNGTVTSDFVQLDRVTLKRAYAREIHEFNDKCEITKITGFVHSNLICPTNSKSITNRVMYKLCRKYEAARRKAGIDI